MEVDNQTILNIVAGQSAIAQQVKDLSQRLFGGDGQLKARIEVLETKNALSSGWFAGAAAVVTWFLSTSHHIGQVAKK